MQISEVGPRFATRHEQISNRLLLLACAFAMHCAAQRAQHIRALLHAMHLAVLFNIHYIH